MAYRQINTRSPFYVQLATLQPLVSLELRIWTGDVSTDKPVAATYTIEKEALGGEATLEIAELIRDYCIHDETYTTGAVWVETRMNDFLAVSSTIYLATEGYTLYTEGLQHNGNTWVSDYAMLPVDTDGNHRMTYGQGTTSKFQVFSNPRPSSSVGTGTLDLFNSSVIVSGISTLFTTELVVGQTIVISGTDYVIAQITNDTLMELTIPFAAASGNYAFGIEHTDFRYDRYNQNGVFLDTTILQPTSDSAAMLRTFALSIAVSRYDFFLDGEDFSVIGDEWTCNKWNSGGLIATTAVNPDFGKPVTLHYVNKLGAKNTFGFSLKHTETISMTSDTFNRNVTNYSNLNAGNGLHASRKRITGSKQSFTINTDYITEYYVKQLEELMMSEYVWAYIPHVSANLIPVNLSNSKLQKKNHLNDGLIQYTFDLTTASEYINNVR